MTEERSGTLGGFVVPREEAGQRLDKLVARRVGLGRRRTAELFTERRVLVDGRAAKKGELAQAGARIEVRSDIARGPAAESEAPLDVRLETPALIVVRKPARQPSVAVRPDDTGTLAQALAGHYPEMQALGRAPGEAGLVHRLDTGTSGLLVAARTPLALERLTAAVVAGTLHKRYLAIVESRDLPGSGIIDSPLSTRDKKKVTIARESMPGARAARTQWRVIRRAGRWALLEVVADRAQRHQIRAHLASIDHPLAADTLYGGVPIAELAGRHALHASHLSFEGDDALEAFSVDDVLPDDLQALLG